MAPDTILLVVVVVLTSLFISCLVQVVFRLLRGVRELKECERLRAEIERHKARILYLEAKYENGDGISIKYP